MDLAAVMDEIKNRLTSTLADLNGFAYPPGTVTPPAAIVTYPDRIDYGTSYANGMSEIESLPVVLVVGKVSDADTRDTVALYAAGSGPRSVRQILEAAPHTAFFTLKVVDCEFSVYTEAANTYLAATFHCDITGPGS